MADSLTSTATADVTVGLVDISGGQKLRGGDLSNPGVFLEAQVDGTADVSLADISQDAFVDALETMFDVELQSIIGADLAGRLESLPIPLSDGQAGVRQQDLHASNQTGDEASPLVSSPS